MILEAWPDLKALRKEEDGGWEEFEPRFRVVKPYRPQKVKKQPQLELAFDHIPVKPTLSHMQKLNAGVIALVTNPGLLEASTPALLAEVSAAKFGLSVMEGMRTLG